MPNYAAWPTAADVLARLAAVGVTLRGDNTAQTNRLNALIAAVTAEVGHATKQQFIADPVPDDDNPALIRTYDGTDSAELEVDPLVELLGVTIVGGYGTPTWEFDLSSVRMIEEYGKPLTRLIVGQGSLPAYATAAVLTPNYYIFPGGRQNIRVQARWGYGAMVPTDLWEAVCGEIAVRATRESLFAPGGRLSEEQYGDERKKFALNDAEATGWHGAFERATGSGPGGYRRSQGRRLRRLRGSMIDS